MSKIIGREFKHAVHLKANRDRDDTHVIKEILHYEDGTTKPNLSTLTNFKRPFYMTKPHNQNHKQKKEFEYLDKLNTYYSTQSDLPNTIAMRTGKIGYTKNYIRDVIDNPYIYGVDIKSTNIIKKIYEEKYPNLNTENTVAALDIENDVDTGTISMITIVMKDKIFTAVLNTHVEKIKNPLDTINSYYDKYMPDTELINNLKDREVKIVDNELDLVIEVINRAHKWQPDFLAIWNINYDLPKMIDVIERFGMDPADVFSDPSLPKELRNFWYKEGQRQRVTESGKVFAITVEQQWHFAYCPASFVFVDAMAAYSYVRVGQAAVPGGYGLDNILKTNGIHSKLKFDDSPKYKGADWHRYMCKEKPIEYIIYNMYDTLAMLELEDKTKDLTTSMPILSGISDYDIFNSGPKKIVDGLHFFYLENGRVIGTKPSKVVNDKILGLDEWIKRLSKSLQSL